MNSRNVWMILLAMTIATTSVVAMLPSSTDDLGHSGESRMSLATCDDVEGHCFNVDTEFMMEMESPSHTRVLWQKPGRDRYITYAALRADSIPCGWQGNSYYDCTYSKRVNAYHRGCSAATRCFRYTH